MAFLGFNTAIAQVGIGTENPTNKLDVNGDVRIRTIEDLPDDTTFKNIVADDSGVVKSIETSRVLAGGDGVDAIPTSTTISTPGGGSADHLIASRTFTLTQRSIVSISSSVSVANILRPNGTSLTDGIAKLITLNVKFDETGGDSVPGNETIVEDAFPFTPYISGYASGYFFLNVSAKRVLEPGTYIINFKGRVYSPGTNYTDQGVKATFAGATHDRIDIIAQPIP